MVKIGFQKPNSQELYEDFLSAHSEQASVTTLNVKNMDCIDFDDPENGVEMSITLGLSGKVPTLLELSLASIIAEKH